MWKTEATSALPALEIARYGGEGHRRAEQSVKAKARNTHDPLLDWGLTACGS
jgi:hypothetical protein